jgi:hypothetical protein
MIVRRLVLVFSIVFCGSLALAAAAVAAVPGPLPPGDYTFSSTSANAFFGGKGGGPQPSFSVFVNQGLNSFQPSDGDNNDSGSVIPSTMVQFTAFDSKGVGGTACYIIPNSDFKVSKNLQSASLHTTLSSGSVCPGLGAPVGGAPVPGPKAGSGGGLPPSIKVDLTWSGVGVVSTMHDRFTFSCLAHRESGTNTFRDSLGGTASGTIGTTSGLSTLVADVSAQDGQLDIQGNIQPPCFGK